jgi:hypothetical protein
MARIRLSTIELGTSQDRVQWQIFVGSAQHSYHPICSPKSNIRIRKEKTTLQTVICGCKTWSLTLRESTSYKTVRKIYGAKTD